MALELKELRRSYILGLLNEHIFDNSKYKDDPAVQQLRSEIQRKEVQKVDLTADPKSIAQQLFAAHQKGQLSDGDVVKLAINEPPESPLRGAAQITINMIDKQQIQRQKPATTPGISPSTPPPGEKPKIEVKKDFDKLRAEFVIELDKATIDNLVKSYARGQAVAMWESSKGKEKITLGGPDPQKQVEYLIQAMKPIHEYNDRLATILTKRITDQVNSGTSPGVIAKGMTDTITHFMKAPVEVPLKGPDGKPKLDKDGNQVVRIYTPENYANLLARTLTYSLRNRGYIDHYKTMGLYDGWISVCSADERSCKPCNDKDGHFFPWDSPQEPPAYHPFCRCRPKAHLSKDAEEGFLGPDDGRGGPPVAPQPPVPPVTVPTTTQAKIQAWQDWTVDVDYASVKGQVEGDMKTVSQLNAHPDLGMDYVGRAGPDKNSLWINDNLSEVSKTHALVGAYGEYLASTKSPEAFLGCSREVYVAMKPQTDRLFKEVNVARIANARVNLDVLQHEINDNWQKVIQKGKWLPKDVPLSRISPPSQSSFTEAELWHNLKRTNAEFYDMLNAQVRSCSFLSNPIPVGGGQVKRVPLPQFKEAMQQWRAQQQGAIIPDEMFNDALDMALRNWFKYADSEQWTAPYKRASMESHMGAMLEGLHIDPGMVKEVAPDIYDYLVKQVASGALGEPIKKVLTFTGDLKKNLPQEIKVFKDWDELRNLVQQETGFTVSFRPKTGLAAGIDRKAKEIWLDRSLRTSESSQILIGQYSKLWAEDQAKFLKLKTPEAPIRAFFQWPEGGSLDELDKMLCQRNIAAQTSSKINFEQMDTDMEKSWAFIWQGHASRWGQPGKASEEEVASAIESYLQQLKENGVDLTWAEAPGNTKFTMTRQILGKDQEVTLENYQYWFKRDLEQQMEKLSGHDKSEVTAKWPDIYQYLKTQWWRQAKETSFSGNTALVDPGEKVAAFVTTLYNDEKAVKEMAPKCYDRFVNLNNQGYYGRVLNRIFDTSSTTPLQDITGKMNFTLNPMTNYYDMVREVKKVFPFKHKAMKGAYGKFKPARNVKATEISVRSNLKGSPHAKSTLVHETGHGIDWMNSKNHSCSYSVQALRDNCFPNLSMDEAQEVFDTELKDVMCQVRHALSMNDVRLANSEAEVKALLEDKGSQEVIKRAKKAPTQVDYIKFRSDFLNSIEADLKAGKFQDYNGPVTNLKQYKTYMAQKADSYAKSIMNLESGASTEDFEKAAHAKVEFLNDFLSVANKDLTSLYKSNWDVPVSIYNFDDWAEQYFQAKPIDPDLKQGIKNMVKLSWMQRVEGHCWAGDNQWANRPTERWAVFVQSLYIDPKRTAEIAPKAYKAFMENMRSNKYASVLGKLLGFRAAV